ncbi:hypothetical protein GCM10027517_28560 [Phycicoccus ginsengisoli]
MTRIRVTPEALGALAGALSGVADELAWCSGLAGTDAWALGPGDTPRALRRLLGDFEHQRLLLGRSCEALSAAVRTAGAAYAEVDDGVAAGVAAGLAAGGAAPVGPPAAAAGGAGSDSAGEDSTGDDGAGGGSGGAW